MSNIIKVRDVNFGEGVAKICVPLVGKTENELLEEIKLLKNLDLIEWRVDHFQDVEDIEKVKAALKTIRQAVGNLPILFTFRTHKEGGVKEISTEYYVQLNKQIAATRLIDLVDVELFTGDEIVKNIVECAHSNGVKVVMSNHDFFKTPEKQEIINRLCNMNKLNADLPKIAVMPQNARDVITLLDATEQATHEIDTPIITMSMGSLGLISRLSGQTFGSALTFGAAKTASAPGQIAVEDLYNILNKIKF